MFGKKKKPGSDDAESKAKPKKERAKKPKAKKERAKKAKPKKPKKTKQPRSPRPKVSIGQQMDVFTVMLGIALFAVTLSCALLFLELSRYGSFPWWKI